MSVSKESIKNAYQKYAYSYNFSMNIYRLLGLHIEAYRKRAADLLNIKEGDLVIELGCGTGLNFSHILKKIGPEGHLIGVDFSSKMLACEQERVDRSSWKNVQLVHSDIMAYDFPSDVNGIISTGVFGYLNEQDEIIKRISHALAPDGRLVLIDGTTKNRCPSWLFKLFLWLSGPYELTEDYFKSDTRKLVEHHFQNTSYEEVYRGLIFILSGWRDSK